MCLWTSHTSRKFSDFSNAIFLPFFKYKFIYFNWRLNYFTILYWFCHTSTWICHGCTRVPNSEPPSHLPPCTISLGHPSAPAPRILYRTWTGNSFLIWYYTCFNAILSNHLSLSHRVRKSVLYICVSCCLYLLNHSFLWVYAEVKMLGNVVTLFLDF